jgi:hypothetical protein
MKENISVLKSIGVGSDKTHRTNFRERKISHLRTGFDPFIVTLIAEIGVTFFRYLISLGLSRETNLIVLSSKDHYSYDEKDLKNVRILINLKKLNLIKHLDMFLDSLVRILPPNTNFIGYFSEKNTMKGNGFRFNRVLRVFNRLNNFLDSNTDHIMNKNEVTELLERNGFKTIDMKEMNGLTYFISQSVSRPV